MVADGADLVDDSHVGMREAGHRLRLAHEALLADVVAVAALPQELERHPPVEARVVGRVHDPHRAATHLFEDDVAVNRGAASQRRRLARQCVARVERESLLERVVAAPRRRILDFHRRGQDTRESLVRPACSSRTPRDDCAADRMTRVEQATRGMPPCAGPGP